MNLRTRLIRLERHYLPPPELYRPLTADEAALLPDELLERIITLAREIRAKERASAEDNFRVEALMLEIREYLDRRESAR